MSVLRIKIYIFSTPFKPTKIKKIKKKDYHNSKKPTQAV
jgi:hypothetical protein